MKTNELFENRKSGFGFASFIGLAFIGFVAGWVFLIPIATAAFLLYGYVAFNQEQKHRIILNYRPNEALKAIARREIELNREKERIIYEQLHGSR